MDTKYILQAIIDYFNSQLIEYEIENIHWSDDNNNEIIIETKNGIIALNATSFNA